jgi:hypothetical protein
MVYRADEVGQPSLYAAHAGKVKLSYVRAKEEATQINTDKHRWKRHRDSRLFFYPCSSVLICGCHSPLIKTIGRPLRIRAGGPEQYDSSRPMALCA